MSRNILKEIDQITKDLVEHYHPQLVFLFGSAAQNAMTEDSDIDLLVVKQTRKSPIWRRVEARKPIQTTLPVDIIVYTPQEFEILRREKSSFISHIFEKGRILYAKQTRIKNLKEMA